MALSIRCNLNKFWSFLVIHCSILSRRPDEMMICLTVYGGVGEKRIWIHRNTYCYSLVVIQTWISDGGNGNEKKDIVRGIDLKKRIDTFWEINEDKMWKTFKGVENVDGISYLGDISRRSSCGGNWNYHLFIECEVDYKVYFRTYRYVIAKIIFLNDSLVCDWKSSVVLHQ